jgi:hypothetical protein
LGSLTAELTRCPSSQLQTVGELCVGGTCDVHAMGGTICYAVDDVRAAAAHEGGTDVRVLTVVTSVDGMKVVPAQHQALERGWIIWLWLLWPLWPLRCHCVAGGAGGARAADPA